MSDKFSQYLKEFRLHHLFVYANTPKRNSVVERKNRHPVETCRSMLRTKNIPGKFLAECMKTTAHVSNRLL